MAPAPVYLFVDCETTGLPRFPGKFGTYYPPSDLQAYQTARVVQVAWIVCDAAWQPLKTVNVLVKPEGFLVPPESTAIHGVSHNTAMEQGREAREVLTELAQDVAGCSTVIAHNAGFDENVIKSELVRRDMLDALQAWVGKRVFCSMFSTREIVGIRNAYGFKVPKLSELYFAVFGRAMENAHDALADVTATKDAVAELCRRGALVVPTDPA